MKTESKLKTLENKRLQEGNNSELSTNTEFGEDEDIQEIIYKLRKRLEWPCEGIQYGKMPTELKTIDTMKQKQADDGKFVYCIDHSFDQQDKRYNPYDLKIVKANIIKSSKRYFTVSASYVTMVSCWVIYGIFYESRAVKQEGELHIQDNNNCHMNFLNDCH